MTIPWMYLDKKAASVSALKDYPAMELIIANFNDDIRESKAHLTSVRSSDPAMSRGAQNPKAGEAMLSSTLDLIDVVNERHLQAQEYMTWFIPAWNALTADEQSILSAFFLQDGVPKTEIVQALCEEHTCERSALYARKDKAVGRLALLLYGK